MTHAEDEPDLDVAYNLETPDDSRRLYRDWAATYDETFAAERGYEYPARIAALYDQRAGAGDQPVLDVGCGTGLVAEELSAGPVDGVDISPEMLDEARRKGVYRALVEGDLTARLPIDDGAYGGFISAGTFTHGHVGPDALDELARIAKPGALFALGVNAEVFRDLDFRGKLDAMTAAGVIEAPEIVTGEIYKGDADHDHAGDQFQAVIFRRAS